MPKLFLSLLLTIVFAGYVVFQRVLGGGAGEVAYTAPAVVGYVAPVTQATDTSKPNPPHPSPLPGTGEGAAPVAPTPAPASTPVAPPSIQIATPPAPVVPKPVPVAPAPAPVAVPKGQYRDGSYTGATADAYYGNIQVKVVVSGGKISDVQFLDYPQDRSNSVRINTYAMPLLKSEAIKAQSANVDGVSGASFSSAAFKKSLASALVQA